MDIESLKKLTQEFNVNIGNYDFDSSTYETIKKEAEELLKKINGKVSDIEKSVLLGENVVLNNELIYKKIKDDLKAKNIIIEDMSIALKKYNLEKYFFELFDFNDDYKKYHAKYWNSGIFAWFKKDAKFSLPIHALFMISNNAFSQTPHSLIIMEENSEGIFIEGCTAQIAVKNSIHIGATEIFLKENAKLTLIKFQNWPKLVETRPITYAKLGKNSRLHIINVVLGGGKYTKENPQIYLDENAEVKIDEIIVGKNNAKIVIGSDVYLNGENAKANLISKALTYDDVEVKTYGKIVANSSNVKGHIECDALQESGSVIAIPSLVANGKDVDLTHEAAIGKINDNELKYLMSRGFSEDEAKDILINGFISDVLNKIPFLYRREIEKYLHLERV